MPKFNYSDLPCTAPLNIPDPVPNATLLTVLLFIRHGLRSPSQAWHLPGNEGQWNCNGIKDITRFPNVTVNGQKYDYYLFNKTKKYIFPPSCEASSLTDEGVQQLFDLGKLYYKYSINNNLISQTNLINFLSTFSVRSSYVTRCIESALSFLNGFFYKFDELLNQTFDIKTGQKNDEPLAPSPFRSDLIFQNMLKFIDQEEYRKRHRRSEELIQKFRKYLNISYLTHEFESLSFGDYINTLRCNRQEDEVIKSINFEDEDEQLITPEIHREMMRNVFYMEGNFYNFSLAPTVAPIFKLILDKLKKINYKRPEHLFNLFSAHSETLSALITAFGYNSEFTPPFASHFLIEVWKPESSSSFLRVVLNGEEIKRISLHKFKKMAKKLVNQYDQMSKNKMNRSVENKLVLAMKNKNNTASHQRLKIIKINRYKKNLNRRRYITDYYVK